MSARSACENGRAPRQKRYSKNCVNAGNTDGSRGVGGVSSSDGSDDGGGASEKTRAASGLLRAKAKVAVATLTTPPSCNTRAERVVTPAPARSTTTTH